MAYVSGLDRIPAVRRTDLSRTPPARSDDFGRQRFYPSGWWIVPMAILGALGWVLIVWLAYTIGVDALEAVREAMRHGAAEAAARRAY